MVFVFHLFLTKFRGGVVSNTLGWPDYDANLSLNSAGWSRDECVKWAVRYLCLMQSE